MLAFTFPGQGSQRPGMGRPWVDHESWELVDEASEVAERDVARLLLDADADELKDTRNAQLTTFVSSLMVLDAAERLGARAQLLRRPQPRRVHGADGHRRARLRRGRAARGRAGRGDAPGRHREPRHDGRGARPRRRPGRGRLPPRRQRRVGRQLQRARSSGHRRLARGRRRCRHRRQGARRQEGHAAAGVRRVPHAVHGAGPRPPAQGDRRGRTPRHRGPGDLQRRRARPRHAARSGRACCRPSSAARCAGSTACSRWRTHGVTEFVELGPGGVLTGMAKRTVDAARTISVATPEELDKLLEWVNAGAARHAPRSTRASTSSPPSASSSAPRPACSRPIGASADGSRSQRRRRARPRRRHRGALAVRRRAAELHRRRRRAGHDAPTHRLVEDDLTCQHYLPESAVQ